jgi:hypothetical protein
MLAAVVDVQMLAVAARSFLRSGYIIFTWK